MRILLCFFLFFFLFSCSETVTKKNYQSPDKIWGELFVRVQSQRIFEDSKIFADAVPKFKSDSILRSYEKEKSSKTFDLKRFVEQNFTLPNYAKSEQKSGLSFEKYVESTFWSLKREPKDDGGALIPSRKSYFAGGGKFEELNYFRSYLVLRALQALKQDTLATNLAINSAQFIQDFGHVPAGNRTYLMSRSNPPVFALMIKKLSEKDPKQLAIFGTQLMREYQYWMSSESKEEVSAQKQTKEKGSKVFKKVVFLQKENLLNRYFDAEKGPLTEEFMPGNKSNDFYENLRAISESEWIGEKRWIGAHAQSILPVDLNALLYLMEKTLSEVYRAKDKEDYAKSFEALAQKRKAIFDQYFWNGDEGFYFDYDFMANKQSNVYTLAAVFPLLVGLADQKQADKVAEKIQKDFLKSGGLVNEINGDETGTAELQYLSIEALRRYGKVDLAQKIDNRWLMTNRDYYGKFGKIEPSYNVSLPLGIQKNSHQQRIDGSLSVLLLMLTQ
ncbi:MAG TPA: trehalase family glycosidase [Leadbetterella sp.]|nr:trehalase family glycosidase [Leadbetterella sp.]